MGTSQGAPGLAFETWDSTAVSILSVRVAYASLRVTTKRAGAPGLAPFETWDSTAVSIVGFCSTPISPHRGCPILRGSFAKGGKQSDRTAGFAFHAALARKEISDSPSG